MAALSLSSISSSDSACELFCFIPLFFLQCIFTSVQSGSAVLCRFPDRLRGALEVTLSPVAAAAVSAAAAAAASASAPALKPFEAKC